jgi:exopolysaccharide production protein ExoZ
MLEVETLGARGQAANTAAQGRAMALRKMRDGEPVSEGAVRVERQLSLVQVYRGLAALLVVVYHASRIVPVYFGAGADTLLDFFTFGKSGVQFFFVLSGFIIYYIHRDDIGSRSQLLPYAKKRLIRIYPVYIIVTVLLVPFWLLIPTFGEPYHKDLSALILSLLLVPQSHYPHLGVAWTLIHEMLFYALFSALILNRLLGLSMLGVWFAAIGVVNVLGVAPPSALLTYLLSVNNLLFGFGMAAAFLATTQRAPAGSRAVAVFVLGNAGFLAVGLLANRVAPGTWGQQAVLALAFGVASFMILLQSKDATLDAIARRRPLLRFLGDASYSIYLIHYPALSLCCKVMQHFEPKLSPFLVFFGVSIFAVLCGVGLHVSIERPAVKVLRKRLLGTPGPLRDVATPT